MCCCRCSTTGAALTRRGNGRHRRLPNTLIAVTSNLGSEYCEPAGGPGGRRGARPRFLEAVRAAFRPEPEVPQTGSTDLLFAAVRDEMSASSDINGPVEKEMAEDRKGRDRHRPRGQECG